MEGAHWLPAGPGRREQHGGAAGETLGRSGRGRGCPGTRPRQQHSLSGADEGQGAMAQRGAKALPTQGSPRGRKPGLPRLLHPRPARSGPSTTATLPQLTCRAVRKESCSKAPAKPWPRANTKAARCPKSSAVALRRRWYSLQYRSTRSGACPAASRNCCTCRTQHERGKPGSRTPPEGRAPQRDRPVGRGNIHSLSVALLTPTAQVPARG